MGNYRFYGWEQATVPACTEEFRKMYGYASPPAKIEDSDHYRKWKLFEYRKLAEVFDHAAATIRSSSRAAFCRKFRWAAGISSMWAAR